MSIDAAGPLIPSRKRVMDIALLESCPPSPFSPQRPCPVITGLELNGPGFDPCLVASGLGYKWAWLQVGLFAWELARHRRPMHGGPHFTQANDL